MTFVVFGNLAHASVNSSNCAIYANNRCTYSGNTAKTGNSYAGIRVSYQGGGANYDATYQNIHMDNLGGLGEKPRVNSIFYVYRPTYYSNTGN